MHFSDFQMGSVINWPFQRLCSEIHHQSCPWAISASDWAWQGYRGSPFRGDLGLYCLAKIASGLRHSLRLLSLHFLLHSGQTSFVGSQLPPAPSSFPLIGVSWNVLVCYSCHNKSYRPGNSFSYNSGGQQSQIKMEAGLLFSEACLLGWEMALFSPVSSCGLPSVWIFISISHEDTSPTVLGATPVTLF